MSTPLDLIESQLSRQDAMSDELEAACSGGKDDDETT